MARARARVRAGARARASARTMVRICVRVSYFLQSNSLPESTVATLIDVAVVE